MVVRQDNRARRRESFSSPRRCEPIRHCREHPVRDDEQFDRGRRHGRLAKWLGLAALGVVFGELGTSPLYAQQAVVQAMGGRLTRAIAIRIVSPIVWTLILRHALVPLH
jgi:hypothetical protein